MNYSPPMWDRVLEDCEMALKLDPVYTKALNRRAEALEAMDQLEDALRGLLFVSISLSFVTESIKQTSWRAHSSKV